MASIEAFKGLFAAGKNPVSHVGKIYNVLSHKIARELYENIEGIREVSVLLLSRIGTPIDRPQTAAAQMLLQRGAILRDVRKPAEKIFDKELAHIATLCSDLAKGKYPVC